MDLVIELIIILWLIIYVALFLYLFYKRFLNLVRGVTQPRRRSARAEQRIQNHPRRSNSSRLLIKPAPSSSNARRSNYDARGRSQYSYPDFSSSSGDGGGDGWGCDGGDGGDCGGDGGDGD